MTPKVTPKNPDGELVGFYYEVTMGQMLAHQQRTPDEICTWPEETYRVITEMQTPEERGFKYVFKPNKRPITL